MIPCEAVWQMRRGENVHRDFLLASLSAGQASHTRQGLRRAAPTSIPSLSTHEVALLFLLAEVTCLARRQSWEVKSGTYRDFTLSHSGESDKTKNTVHKGLLGQSG